MSNRKLVKFTYTSQTSKLDFLKNEASNAILFFIFILFRATESR